jgi:hypothetical protein
MRKRFYRGLAALILMRDGPMTVACPLALIIQPFRKIERLNLARRTGRHPRGEKP